MSKTQSVLRIIKKYSLRPWYQPFIALLSALDNFVVVIPNDGILITSSMITPKRWWSLAIWIALGSAIGGGALAGFIETFGVDWIGRLFPGIEQTKTWIWTLRFFEDYGLLLVFVISLSPLFQQPGILIASLAGTSFTKITAVLFVGRLIKYLVLAYLGSHAPKLLTKIWGVQTELKEVGAMTEKGTIKNPKH